MSKKTKVTTKTDQDFYQGIAIACSTLVTFLDEPVHAKSIMDSLGVSIQDLKSAGVERKDIQILEKIL